MKKIVTVATLALALIPLPSLAIIQAYTEPNSYNFINPQLFGYIPPGQCLTTTTQSEIVGTGSACASGGSAVTSVTSANANLILSPTTGAVIGNFSQSPIFTGLTTTNTLLVNSTSQFNGTTDVNGSFQADGVTDTTLTPGECVQAGVAGALTSTGSACSGGGGGSINFIPLMQQGAGTAGIPNLTNSPLQNLPYGGSSQNITSSAPVGMTIGHLNVACASFNAADAVSGHSQYAPLDANGLGGATVGFGVVNAANSIDTPLVIGTVVIPDSPQGGPWVTNVSSVVGSPYTVLAGDTLVLGVSGTSVTATQWATACFPMIGN